MIKYGSEQKRLMQLVKHSEPAIKIWCSASFLVSSQQIMILMFVAYDQTKVITRGNGSLFDFQVMFDAT